MTGRHRMDRVVAVVHVPHAVPCANCPRWIRPDGRGGWVHLTKGYPCRDSAGVDTGCYAAPRPFPLTTLDR